MATKRTVSRPTTRRPRRTPLDTTADLEVGRDDAPGGGVDLHRLASGRAALVPRSLRHLDAAGYELVGDLQGTVAAINDLHDRLGELVVAARGRGLSWDAIGWCLGLTGNAVRQRFSD